MSGQPPHDTPVETPAVIESADLGPDPAKLATAALARARSVETLEAAFSAWHELRQAHGLAQRRWVEERKRLGDQGELLLGAVRTASQLTPQPATTGAQLALDTFVQGAQQKLAAARAALEAQIDSAEAIFSRELTSLRAELVSRVERQRQAIRPHFRLSVKSVGDRRILHARRLSEPEAIVALHVFTGRISTRYDFVFDDTTDDLSLPPPSLYAEEGVAPELVRTVGTPLRLLLEGLGPAWPVKGMLPMPTPRGLVRWLQRGPVLEAELEEEGGFRNLLTRDEAELITGLLLAQKLAGHLELELVRD